VYPEPNPSGHSNAMRTSNISSEIVCPHCGNRRVSIFTKKKLLKTLVIWFSIAFFLLFIAVLELLLKNWITSICFLLTGGLSLLQGVRFYVKYMTLKKSYIICNKCKHD
jgi:hypothetical protein